MVPLTLRIVIPVVLVAAALLAWITFLDLSRPHLRIAERARREVSDVMNRTVVRVSRHRDSTMMWLLTPVIRWLDRLPLIDAAEREKFANMLRMSGFRHPSAVQSFIAAKILSGVAFAVTLLAAARMMPPTKLGAVMPAAMSLGGLVFGLILPEFLLRWVVARRRLAIVRGMPDALDLMVICTNAGYSLGATLRRVSVEFRTLNPVLSYELGLTADDISLRGDPLAGLRNLAVRTGIPALHAMVTTLIQSQRYGTPITHSLKTLAQSERRARILALEEKGAKLSTKITIPMMLLILPAVLILAAGPAVLRIMETFAK